MGPPTDEGHPCLSGMCSIDDDDDDYDLLIYI